MIDPEGEQLGIMTVDDALEQAERFGLDLVEVAPNARPPVCRIMDYGKYKYQQKKRSSDARKKGARVKLRPKTDEHDFMTKLKHARRFLEKNNKVKITIMFRGREITHPEIARDMLERAAEELADVAEVEQGARMEGRNMTMMLNFSSKAVAASKKEESEDFDDED